MISRVPKRFALYSICKRNIPKLTSLRDLASLLFAIIPWTFKSSITTAWFSRQSRVVSLWVKSARILAMRASSLANVREDFLQLLDIGGLVPFGNFAFDAKPACTLAASSFRLRRRLRI
jgi:hypothetical protein